MFWSVFLKHKQVLSYGSSLPNLHKEIAIWKHASSGTFGSGNLPVELLHSISNDATTNGAISSRSTGFNVDHSLHHRSMSVLERWHRTQLSPLSNQPVDWIPVLCINLRTGSILDSYTWYFWNSLLYIKIELTFRLCSSDLKFKCMKWNSSLFWKPQTSFCVVRL